ncbi:MAG: tetratricopeptide repeat protein, partial [Hyphomicrobium sp.]
QAAAKGDRTAQRAAGIGYVTGVFGLLDPFKAAGFFKSAVAAGDIAAMPLYAHMMFAGTGVEKDEAGAEQLIERAAGAGLTIAQETLGMWILERYKAGVISDPGEGVRWLERAYQDGHSITALDRLAVFYADEGRGPQWRDRLKAFELFRMAAAYSEPRAQFGYATALQFGHGGSRDLPGAYARYEVARQMNNSSTAVQRQKTLETMLSPAEKDAALEAARLIRRDLKPIPRMIVLQQADQPKPPSPWAAAQQPAPAKP